MNKSLKIRAEYITQVKLAVWRNGFPRQIDLAEELSLSLATISNYLNAKPVYVLNFYEISEKLNLDWKEIADWGDCEVKKLSGIKIEN